VLVVAWVALQVRAAAVLRARLSWWRFVQCVDRPLARTSWGNVMPSAVAGVGVPVNPLAFAGLLGLVDTALSLLPAGRLRGAG